MPRGSKTQQKELDAVQTNEHVKMRENILDRVRELVKEVELEEIHPRSDSRIKDALD